MDYAVLHRISVPGAGARLEARLIITGVPDGTSPAGVRAALDDAGLSADWSDGGIPWGNHDIKTTTRSGAWPRGTEISPDTPRATWDQIQAQAATGIKRITLRVPLSLYGELANSAARIRVPGQVKPGQAIQGWCLDAIRTHLLFTQLPPELRHAIQADYDPADALTHALQEWAYQHAGQPRTGPMRKTDGTGPQDHPDHNPDHHPGTAETGPRPGARRAARTPQARTTARTAP